MTKKRVKVKSEVIKPIEEKPKVRPRAPKTTIKKVEKVLSEMVPTEKVENKKVNTDNKFERHKAFGDLTKRNELIEKVKTGHLRWAFYAVEGENGYHYYRILRK
ncbi:MAG: hypothetical protein ABFD07_00685 [Methanobacterium sp.]